MKRCSTMILRCAIIFAGAVMIVICGALAWITFFENRSNPYILEYIAFAGVCAAAIPYFIALYQAMKLLQFIDTGCAFSDLSVKSLDAITHCAIVIFIIVTVAGLPFFYVVTQLEDAPGIMLFGMTISGCAFLIAVFASVLKRLLLDAIEMKTENDLTI